MVPSESTRPKPQVEEGAWEENHGCRSVETGTGDQENRDSPWYSPGSLDLGTEGGAGWLVLILEGGTITMPLWRVLKGV